MTNDQNETTGIWRDYRQAQQARRLRLPVRTQEILDLRAKNFTVERLTDFQFRIDGVLDLYPTHRRFHNVTTGRRGGYSTAISIAVNQLRKVT